VNNRLTEEGGTAVLVRCGVDHHAVPDKCQERLEATPIQIILASKPLKILAVYLSPSLLLVLLDLSA